MSQEESTQTPSQARPVKQKKTAAKGVSPKDKRDDDIMGTNNSSIVSKRSVEKLYYQGQPEYFRHFVKKFQRRAPLINRGYWLRMRAIEESVKTFLAQEAAVGTTKVVINLGCGYDPLPYQMLGGHADLCKDAVFVDVDYPQLIQRKLQMITQTPAIMDVIPGFKIDPSAKVLMGQSPQYLTIGCDLRELEKLEAVLRNRFDIEHNEVEIMFSAEVSVAYMTREAADNVLKWASRFDNVRFCLLEQHLPDGRDHPFAQTMLKHFEKLKTPLHAVDTLDTMRGRFHAAGWPEVRLRSLWELWSDDQFNSPEVRLGLDNIEPFDEWEEFALFGSHYFLLLAAKYPGVPGNEFERPELLSAIETSSYKSSEFPAQLYSSQPLQGKLTYRRFGALLPSETPADTDSVGYQGGLGTRERSAGVDVYTCSTTPRNLRPPPISPAVMCHTITPVGKNSSDCLLVGGRTSPDRASAQCWYRKDGTWSRAHDLPEGRFRHCAVAVTVSGMDGVLVHSGRNSRGEVLSDWLLWTPSSGWSQLPTASSDVPAPRFGAAMASYYNSWDAGALVGGMRRDGIIYDEFWEWKLVVSEDGSVRVACEAQTEARRKGPQSLGRLGAALVPTSDGLLLVGGVAKDVMLTREHEIFNVDTGRFFALAAENRPLLTGFVATAVESNTAKGEDLLVLGGGGTCFSFGTCWSTSCLLSLTSDVAEPKWNIQDEVPGEALQQAAQLQNGSAIPTRQKAHDVENHTSEPTTIPRRTISSASDFSQILAAGSPVILTGLDLGPCTQQWTNDYLKAKVGSDRKVVVHSSPTPHMNFQSKNFSYTTQTFGSLLDSASAGDHLYLRALSASQPAEKPTNIAEDFPSIAADFSLPPVLEHVQRHAHSSPLRISGPVNMWLHYDVMANVYCQIRGSKHMLLFPPSDVTLLSFPPGASSSTIDPFSNPSALAGTRPYAADLAPGDVLFVPPLWLHAARPTAGLSVAVNVFFRDEATEGKGAYAAGRDVYGNRDLAAYERGRRDVARIAKSFEGVETEVRRAYLGRLVEELRGLKDA